MAVVVSAKPVTGVFECQSCFDSGGLELPQPVDLTIQFSISLAGSVSFVKIFANDREQRPLAAVHNGILRHGFRHYRRRLEKLFENDLAELEHAVSNREVDLAEEICTALPEQVWAIGAVARSLFRLQRLRRDWNQCILLAVRLEEEQGIVEPKELAAFYMEYALLLRTRGHRECSEWFFRRGLRTVDTRMCGR